jgi:hypothetical protein
LKADVGIATGLALGMLALYNANGREIPNYDSQPTKYAARELLLRGTLSLNYVVGRTPELAKRSAFVETANGRFRSAYSPVPPVIAAAVTWPFWKLGAIDIRAPLAPALMAAATSSLLVSLAVVVSYLTARVRLRPGRAFWIAVALGAGTGFWPTASQTLWQHESAIFGLSMSAYAATTLERGGWLRPVLLGVGLGLAGASRMQLAPIVVTVLAGAVAFAGWRRAAVAAAFAGAVITPVLVTNYLWFGTILGAAPLLEALHETVHATSSSFSLQSDGFAGLLVSPNRGLLIFSPVAAVALIGAARAIREGWRTPHRWLLLAAAAQFVLYGLYSVWWGGHTYGPRYMLDVLPLLVPAATFGVDMLRTRPRVALASVALAWSIGVSALGAFNYPEGRWNNEPGDVDRTHERLWDWSDTQIVRTWQAGRSPQNFTLLTRATLRQAQGGR